MAKLETVIQRNPRANQPAASAVAVGTLYCVTDELDIVERSNGTAWEAFGAAGTGDGDVTGPVSSVAGHVAVFADATGKVLEDGGVGFSVFVSGPASATTGHFARFADATGKEIEDSGFSVFVSGPASAVDGHLAVFDGTSGVLVKDGGAVPTGDVVGPSSSVNHRIAVFDGTTGKVIEDGGSTIAEVVQSAIGASGTGDVVGPAAATDGHLAVFDGSTGKLLKDGGVAPSGDVTGPASSISGHLAVFSGATGKVLADGGAVPAGDVVGPASATDAHLAVFSGATGKLIADGGAVPTGNVTGAASSTDNALPRFDGTGGKTLQGSSVVVDDADNLSGAASAAIGASLVTNTKLTVGGQYVSPMVADGNSGASKTINWADGNEHYLTLTASTELTFSNPVNGGRYVLLVNSGSGSYTVTWPSAVKWSGTAPTMTATASKLDLYTFIYSSTLSLYFGAYNQNYATS